jgi:hypothetical protein
MKKDVTGECNLIGAEARVARAPQPPGAAWDGHTFHGCLRQSDRVTGSSRTTVTESAWRSESGCTRTSPDDRPSSDRHRIRSAPAGAFRSTRYDSPASSVSRTTGAAPAEAVTRNLPGPGFSIRTGWRLTSPPEAGSGGNEKLRNGDASGSIALGTSDPGFGEGAAALPVDPAASSSGRASGVRSGPQEAMATATRTEAMIRGHSDRIPAVAGLLTGPAPAFRILPPAQGPRARSGSPSGVSRNRPPARAFHPRPGP